MKTAKALFVFIFLAASSALCDSQRALKVGAILPLSGSLSFVGEALKEGLLIGHEEAGAGIEILFEDGKTVDRAAATTALNKLLHVDTADIIVNDIVNTMTALAPILNRERVPGVVLWDSNAKISSLGEYIYGFGYSTEAAGRVMAQFAVRQLQKRSFALVTLQDEWSQIIANAFESKVRELGGEAVLKEEFLPEHTDFRSLVTRLRKEGAGAVYAPLYLAPLMSFVRQLHEQKFDGVLLLGDGFTDVEARELGEAVEGAYVTQMWVDDARLRRSREQSGFRAGLVALGYDFILCLNKALDEMRAAGLPVSPESVQTQFKTLVCSGLTGTVKFGISRTTDKEERVLQVRDGKMLPLN